VQCSGKGQPLPIAVLGSRLMPRCAGRPVSRSLRRPEGGLDRPGKRLFPRTLLRFPRRFSLSPTNTVIPQENLYYVCVCSDGSRPNLTQYSETIPYYLCTLDQADCIKGCADDNSCSDQCRKTYVCGATSPKKINSTATGTRTSASSTPGASGTGVSDGDGFATTGTADADNAAGNLLLKLGSSYGVGLVAAGIAFGAAFVGL